MLRKAPDQTYEHLRAVSLFRETGNRPEEGRTLNQLGDVHADAGDLAAARDTWRRAADLLDQVGPAEQVAAIRAKLDRVDRRASIARTNGRA